VAKRVKLPRSVFVHVMNSEPIDICDPCDFHWETREEPRLPHDSYADKKLKCVICNQLLDQSDD
jgi:hypothetical protein